MMATDTTLCGACYSDKREVSAVNWCMECEDSFCTECSKYHSLNKTLNRHHLFDITLKLQQSIFADIPNTTCETHKGQHVQYFCSDHDQLCRHDCLTKTHKSCENTVSLESASSDIKRSGIITDYTDRLDAILETANILAHTKNTYSTEFMQQCQIIKDEIQKTKETLTDRLHEMETETLGELGDIIEACSCNFEKEKYNALKIRENSESYKHGIAFCNDHLPKRYTFIFIKKLENRLKYLEAELEKITSNCKNVSIDFKESREIETNVKTLGTIDFKGDLCNVKYTPKKQPQAGISMLTMQVNSVELKHTIDISDKTVTGIAVTDDNKILLCDRSSSGISVYNEQYQFVKAVKTSQSPWDMAVMPNTDKSVVTFYTTNFFQFFCIKSLTCGRQVTIDDEYCAGVASTADKILIGGKGRIHVLNIEGDFLQTLSVSGNRVNYISIASDNTRYYYSSDWKGYFCIDENGSQIFSYRMEYEKQHRDIETDFERIAYLVGRNTNTIQRLNPDGSFDCIILDKNNGIKEPLAICLNHMRNELYVSNYGNRKLLVFAWG